MPTASHRHLREDRRHIRDADIAALKALPVPLNLEMAATDEMVASRSTPGPHAACLVPEKREERTTEGGLDIVGGREHLAPRIATLTEAGIRVSLFVEPDEAAMEAAHALGAPVVELHTGSYCEAAVAGDAARVCARTRPDRARRRPRRRARPRNPRRPRSHPRQRRPRAAVPQLRELNIGHALIAEAIFVGLRQAVHDMRAAMDRARR